MLVPQNIVIDLNNVVTERNQHDVLIKWTWKVLDLCGPDLPNFSPYKVLESNIAIIRTHVFEWYVVPWGSKNGHQKDTCIKEIGLCHEHILTTLGSTIHMNGGSIAPLNEHKNLHLDLE